MRPAINSPDAATPTTDISGQILRQVLCCGSLSPDQSPSEYVGFVENLFDQLQPRGAIEALLAGQLLGSFLISMNQLAQATRETTVEAANLRLSAAGKMQKIFTQQLGLLCSLRGIKSQHVKIERIDISGGQSIIGSQIERG